MWYVAKVWLHTSPIDVSSLKSYNALKFKIYGYSTYSVNIFLHSSH